MAWAAAMEARGQAEYWRGVSDRPPDRPTPVERPGAAGAVSLEPPAHGRYRPEPGLSDPPWPSFELGRKRPEDEKGEDPDTES